LVFVKLNLQVVPQLFMNSCFSAVKERISLSPAEDALVQQSAVPALRKPKGMRQDCLSGRFCDFQ